MMVFKALFSILSLIILTSCEFGDTLESNNLVASNSFLRITAISAPQDGTYGQGGTLDFELTFTHEVTVSGTPCFALDIGGTPRTACYQSGSASTILTFSHTVNPGDNDANGIGMGSTVDLNGGSFTSSQAQNDLDLSSFLPDLSSVRVDTSFSPPDKVSSVKQTNLSVDRTTVDFNWTAPNDNGTPITHYIVRYKRAGEVSYSYLSPNPITTSATIAGLVSGNTYDIQVSASNGLIGAFSNTLNVSTVFNPKSLGALVWYEAKDINGNGASVADGTAITSMVDKSGNGNNAVKISGTDATIQTVDGYKVLRMGAAGYRTISSLGETANTDIEVYIIAKTRAVSNSFAFVNENEGNANRFGTHFPWGNSNAYVDLPIGNRMNGHWGGNTTDFFAWTFRGSTTQGKALERNGTPVLSAGNRSLTPPLKRWTIGSRYDGGALYWQADMQSFFVFEKILDAQQRTDFFQYIEDEYGVTMN